MGGTFLPPSNLAESPTAAGAVAKAPPQAPRVGAPPPDQPTRTQNINRALGQVKEEMESIRPLGVPVGSVAHWASNLPADVPEVGGVVGSLAPGVLGMAPEALKRVPVVGHVARGAEWAARQPFVRPVLNMLGAGGGAATGAYLTGENMGERAGLATLGQGLGEAIGGVIRQGVMRAGANKAFRSREAQFEADKARHAADTAADKARYETGTAADKARYAQDRAAYEATVAQDKALRARAVENLEAQRERRQYAENVWHQQATQQQQAAHGAAVQLQQQEAARNAERAAEIIANHYKREVPAFKDMPSGTKGLGAMVFGDGPQKLSAAYEEAVGRVVKEKGRGVQVQIPVEAAMRLGNIPIPPDVVKRMSAAHYGLGRETPGGIMETTIPIDAEALFRTAQGKSMDHPAAYRAAMGVLEQAGLVDPAARAAYRRGQELIHTAKSSGMIRPATSEGPERFDPQKVMDYVVAVSGQGRAGQAPRAKIESLRQRGGGNIYEGVIPEASRAALPRPEIPKPAPIPKTLIPPTPEVPPLPVRTKPVKPPDRPKPVARPEPVEPTGLPPGVSEFRLPHIPYHAGWGGALGAGAHFLGGASYPTSAMLGALPSTVSNLRVVTQAPVNRTLEEALMAVPGILGQEAVTKATSGERERSKRAKERQ